MSNPDTTVPSPQQPGQLRYPGGSNERRYPVGSPKRAPGYYIDLNGQKKPLLSPPPQQEWRERA